MYERTPARHSIAGDPLTPDFCLISSPGRRFYKEYIQKVIERLPNKRLTHRPFNIDYEFVTGSISDLPLLFPEATLTTGQSVYVPLHPGMPPVNSRSH